MSTIPASPSESTQPSNPTRRSSSTSEIHAEDFQWLMTAMKMPAELVWTPAMEARRIEVEELLRRLVSGIWQEQMRAVVVLGKLRGISPTGLSRVTGVPRPTLYRWWYRFRDEGTPTLFCDPRSLRPKIRDDEKVKAAVFSIIHSPPASHKINRTSWKLSDICQCLSQQGIHTSANTVGKIIKTAGYNWRKARTVLTSNDPEYREKLERIKSILFALGENDRFCSIDEFGHFAVKMKGGRRIVAPDEYPQVPQFQKSKGWLILTAALELSQNQVTHFYSRAKNTSEMIKLLEVLLLKYKGCDNLYLSWDAASWHASKELYRKVEQVNQPDNRAAAQTPFVTLVPLPSSAQFLNVIEAVFSGMAKAIIHNSDYQSVEEAMAAIDRYFLERNEYFQKHPKRAGRKIWGKEQVVCEFAESNNCKNAKFR